ncbi:beta-1,4-mannosyltransferase [Strigomonas culicis]|uniref:Beta-1,4-mannosyltransferase n=1 Tax=Strigomonas culicis TaxID=28005 RepID=S9U0A8_9TRYP|nr:beta-1,4-mannosyltransferase [Strigomonas culicis]EPY24172.1 beta-1,4-mannosyltransferase [Strigomonas culicis]|eukprot:EPY22289.1 beta-1,4-mannosyltransferase [Strigomonas culicis]
MMPFRFDACRSARTWLLGAWWLLLFGLSPAPSPGSASVGPSSCSSHTHRGGCAMPHTLVALVFVCCCCCCCCCWLLLQRLQHRCQHLSTAVRLEEGWCLIVQHHNVIRFGRAWRWGDRPDGVQRPPHRLAHGDVEVPRVTVDLEELIQRHEHPRLLIVAHDGVAVVVPVHGDGGHEDGEAPARTAAITRLLLPQELFHQRALLHDVVQRGRVHERGGDDEAVVHDRVVDPDERQDEVLDENQERNRRRRLHQDDVRENELSVRVHAHRRAAHDEPGEEHTVGGHLVEERGQPVERGEREEEVEAGGRRRGGSGHEIARRHEAALRLIALLVLPAVPHVEEPPLDLVPLRLLRVLVARVAAGRRRGRRLLLLKEPRDGHPEGLRRGRSARRDVLTQAVAAVEADEQHLVVEPAARAAAGVVLHARTPSEIPANEQHAPVLHHLRRQPHRRRDRERHLHHLRRVGRTAPIRAARRLLPVDAQGVLIDVLADRAQRRRAPPAAAARADEEGQVDGEPRENKTQAGEQQRPL